MRLAIVIVSVAVSVPPALVALIVTEYGAFPLVEGFLYVDFQGEYIIYLPGACVDGALEKIEAGDGGRLDAQCGGGLFCNGAVMGCVLWEQLEGELLNHVRLGIYPKTGCKDSIKAARDTAYTVSLA